MEEDAVWSARTASLNLKTTTRTKIFKGKGNKSRFECHVHDPPSNINIEPVMKKVINIMEAAWVSEIRVLMNVRFRNLGNSSILASGGGSYFVQMSDTFKTVLPVAAAEAVRKRDLNSNQKGDGKYDILCTVNSLTPWFDDVSDSALVPPTHYDLTTVLLHEIYHNLIFAGNVVATHNSASTPSPSFRQTASLYKNYRTRFDSFLMNEDNCAVLGYLTDSQLSSSLNLNTNQLLADAVCNDKLYWGYGNARIAKLHAPRVFMKKSSIYHFDPSEGVEHSLMFPTVRRGSRQHVVSSKILTIQRITLNPSFQGANDACVRPLKNPTPGYLPTAEDFRESDDVIDGGDVTPLVVLNPREFDDPDGSRIGSLPVWAFILILVIAVLLFILLISLCLAICLKKKPKKSGTSTSSITRVFTKLSSYRSKSKSSSRRDQWGPGSSPHTSVRPTSKHSSTSKHTSKTKEWGVGGSDKNGWGGGQPSSKTQRTKTTSKKSGKDETCPSSGKSRRHCWCKICSSPAPIMSVHTFDPDSVPSHRHKGGRRGHKHTHGCQKSLKKPCKKRATKHCYCYCCKYRPSTCKSSTKCCKSNTRSSSSRCPPPSTNPACSKRCSKESSYTRRCSKDESCSRRSSRECRKSSSCKPCKGSASRAVPSTAPPSCKKCKVPRQKCGCKLEVEIDIC